MSKRHKYRVPGKSLDKQREDFNPNSFCGESREEVILKDTDFKRIKQMMFDISRINDLRKLQERLVIWNINEFMVCNKPTPEDFYKIVSVQNNWSKRFLHLVKMTEERDQYIGQVDILASLAFERFEALSKKYNRPT